ncbi:MAG: vanadium-dependent haloperoxidase [Alphaproteobacteria bacterium]|nr:vanadium-dependent haloperoxidase [Alphaproteobacteria bacterium]
MSGRRLAALCVVLVLTLAASLAARAESPRPTPEVALHNWYGLLLELVRHTPTYSPPVASRAFGYLGVAAYESAVGGSGHLVSLAGQLRELDAVPQREAGAIYDEAVIINSAMATAVQTLFSNTGPTGQRVVKAASKKWRSEVSAGIADDVVARSEAFGQAVADTILDWSQSDGGSVVTNMGFPFEYDLARGDGKWVPTSRIAQQQMPLLPGWGNNRPFAMPSGKACPTHPPLAFSEEKTSEFYREAMEVYDTSKALDAEQTTIARFWSDDPMLSTTPPGHWISIALQVADQNQLRLEDRVDLLARLGLAMSDAFIGCWRDKFEHNLIRPVTYIRKFIDPVWEPILITPPFPEYPSGHSTVSAAAATVLTGFFGDSFAFEDATGTPDGRAARRYASFWDAANEAGISRLYGGIHFRAAIAFGLDQGRCIGAYAVALRTRK